MDKAKRFMARIKNKTSQDPRQALIINVIETV